MSRRAQLVVLAVLLLLLGLAFIAPPAKSDRPVTSGPIPQSEFVPLSVVLPSPVGSATEAPRSAGPLSGQAIPALPSSSPAASAPATVRMPELRASRPFGASVSPSARPIPTVAPVLTGGLGAAPAASVTGLASWYAYIPGGAAAGPALRTALGPGWRGQSVAVCRTDGGAMACVRVTLSDFMRADRLIDLDSRSFAALMPLSRGLVTVEILP